MNETVTAAPEPPVEAPVAAPEAPATPTPAPTAPAAPVEAKTAPDPVRDRSSTIREAMIAKGVIKPQTVKPGEKPRDVQGRFAPSPIQAAKATNQPASAAPAPAPVVEDIPLPRSLKKELEAHWKGVHPDLKKAYAERDANYDKGIAQYRTQAQAAEALLNELKPYEQVFKQTGTDARGTIRNLMPIAAVLATGTPEQKATVITRAMQQYGVSVEHLNQALQGQPQNSPMMHPEVQALARQVQQLTQTITTNQERTQAAESQRISAMAESFGRDKPNFEQLRPQMWSLLQAQATAESQGLPGPLGSQLDTSLWSESQWIENAYNAAIRLDPNFLQSEIARHRDEALRAERDKANQAAQASRAAAVQVRGAPSGPASPSQIDPKDRQAVIRTALRSHS